MEDTIPPGTRIRIQCDTKTVPLVGQVVACQLGEELAVHRLVYRGRRRRARSFVVTRGDALWWPDTPVRIDEIVGTVTEMSVDNEWVHVPASAALPRNHPWLRRTALMMTRTALEIHPAFGTAIAILIGRLRRLKRALAAAWDRQ